MQNTPSENSISRYIGQYCIIRSRDAGVHAGVVLAVEGSTVHLSAARRLDRFFVAGSGDSLTAVALDGIIPTKGRIQAPVDVAIIGACEIILASPASRSSIEGAPVYAR